MPETLVEVLIVGAGPSGLAAALWMSYLGVNFRIIERRPNYPRNGQADGLNARTMEVFEGFGIHDDVAKLWEPASDEALWYRNTDGNLKRLARYRSPLPWGVRWTNGTLQQGIVEEIMKDKITAISSIKVEYNTVLSRLDIDATGVEDPQAYPCSADILRVAPHPETNTVLDTVPCERLRAKYVIGADGGRSVTRQFAGFEMDRTKGNSLWGVMDFAGISDFPDFRAYTVLKSELDGAIDFVRREGNLTRMYVELNKGEGWNNLDRNAITSETIIRKCQAMLHPYELKIKHCAWWSSFTASQGLSRGMNRYNRVFLVGDAVHTHSPCTGMGMNTSIQDSYNLGWKLAGVVKGQLNRGLLLTYETERRQVAERLLDADRTVLQMFDFKLGTEPAWFSDKVAETVEFLNGRAIRYDDPLLTSRHPGVIGKLVSGECFPEIEVSNHATGKFCNIQSLLRVDGSWHGILFAGDVSIADQMDRIHSLTSQFEEIQTDIYNTSGFRFNNLLIHCAQRTTVELADFPQLFYPSGTAMGRHHEKIFLDESSEHDQLGISRADGVLVILRPDRYIGWLGGLDNFENLQMYLHQTFLHRLCPL